MSKSYLVPILLPADPVAPMEATTKQYVDDLVGSGGGAGADEVWIGAEEPTDPAIELWVDSDDPSSNDPDTARWNSAWGLVMQSGYPLASVDTPPGYERLALSYSMTFTGTVGRRYRMVASSRAAENILGGMVVLEIQQDGAIGPPTMAEGFAVHTGQYQSVVAERVFTGDGVTHTYVVVGRSLNVCKWWVDGASSLFYIEDIGPVTPSSPPPTAPWSGAEAVKPVAPNAGHRYFATDTQRDWLYDGTGWIVMSEPPQGYTPTATNVTVGDANLSGTFHRSDGWCDVTIFFGLGASSAVGTGPRFSFPIPPYIVGVDQIGLCSLYDATGACFSSTVYIVADAMEPRRDGTQITASVPMAWAPNDYFSLNARYRMASRYY